MPAIPRTASARMSIEGQLRECMAYAERSGITIIGNYIDRAMSARTADRPDFQRMINDSEKHLFDAVHRCGSSTDFPVTAMTAPTYKRILKKNGVKVDIRHREHQRRARGYPPWNPCWRVCAEVLFRRAVCENPARPDGECAMKGKNNGGTVPLGHAEGSRTACMELDPITAPTRTRRSSRRYDKRREHEQILWLPSMSVGIRTAKGLPFRIGEPGHGAEEP